MTFLQALLMVLLGSILLTMFGLGLASTWRDATGLLRQPAMLARAVLAMYGVMPVFVAAVAMAADLPYAVKAALVALMLSPVPPMLQRQQLRAGGRREYVVGLMVAMAVLAIVVVPLGLAIVDALFDRSGSISFVGVAKVVLVTELLPLAAGLLVRRWLPMAEKASGAVITCAGVVLWGGIVLLLWALWPAIAAYFGNGVVLMLALVAAVGLCVGHGLGGPRDSDRTSLAMSTALRHPAVALAIVMSVPGIDNQPGLAIVLLYAVVAALVAAPYQVWRRRALQVA